MGQELSPDYSMESHQRDHENYVACSRGHRRRAKALLDFERHDDDELGFRKNDIITVRGHVGAASARGGELGRGKRGDPGLPRICPCSTHMAVGTGPGQPKLCLLLLSAYRADHISER